MKQTTILYVLLLTSVPCVAPSAAADWPQWGGSPGRNNVSDAKNLPAEWNVGEFDHAEKWISDGAKNIRWVARLGTYTYGTPVVAGGKVFCATNNGAGYLKRYPATVDLGCLLAFRQSDGRFLWQLSREKLAAGRDLDYREMGICSTPLVEGKRLWLVTNRCEVLCLDTEGGPGPGEARILWSLDMIGRLGVVPHNMSSCSVTAAGDLLLVNTSHGVDKSHRKVPAPQAPSFIALDKNTGKLVWADSSPGGNILHGQWSSPAYAVIGGVPQAIFAGGDGWVYSFQAQPGNEKWKLLWKFDCNPKASVWQELGDGDRASLVATPVVHDGRVFIATGDDPEFGPGPGHLWCIDATRRGDVSPEIVFDKTGWPVPPRRLRALDKAAGETARPNPNSAAVWHYTRPAASQQNADSEKIMHRALGMAAIAGDLLVVADLMGMVHCLDARTGKSHWTYDMMSQAWGSPLIADGKIYIAAEDRKVAVLECSSKLKLLAENNMGDAVHSTPVAVGDTLYISTRTHLVAIGK